MPEPKELRRFVSRPPPGGGRLHCTMLRHAVEPVPCYTLYLEYLGGLVPLLKGRRTSKIRPEFVIFDPQNQDTLQVVEDTSQCPSFSDGSDTEKDTADLCGSPRNKRKSRRKKEEKSNEETDDLTYVDTLPEVKYSSNISWDFAFHDDELWSMIFVKMERFRSAQHSTARRIAAYESKRYARYLRDKTQTSLYTSFLFFFFFFFFFF